MLNATVGQRITRKLCDKCKQSYQAEPQVAENIRQVLGDFLPSKYRNAEPIILFKSTGCTQCNNSGYYGRMGIFEVIKSTPSIHTLIIKESTASDIQAQAQKEGLIIMKQDGYLKALEGITTIEEVLRVAEV
ncbi:MAG: hypothetical protein ACMG6E_09980 [Candidatus Roizmanbacteria bacterium]